jgi:hypothetical protein
MYNEFIILAKLCAKTVFDLGNVVLAGSSNAVDLRSIMSRQPSSPYY